MTAYTLFGSINTIFISISIIGVILQLRTVWLEKSDPNRRSVTSMLSINQFFVSFLAYFSFFIYGYSIEPFNHYIVWPRLVAALVVVTVLYEIWRDRREKTSSVIFTVAALILMLGILGCLSGQTIRDESKLISTGMILCISVLIAQGYCHQFVLIVKHGHTGVINIRMSQFIFAMDITTIAFALCMPLSLGWPLLVLALTSATTKVIMMYLFYWTKHSPIAEKRRLFSDTAK